MVDKFPYTGKIIDMFPFTDDINSIVSRHVETVVLLSQQRPKDKIRVELDLTEMDITAAEQEATYREIKDVGIQLIAKHFCTGLFPNSIRTDTTEIRRNGKCIVSICG